MPSDASTGTPRSSGSTGRVVVAAGAVVGVALVAVGTWLALRPRTVGWFAYAPLAETVYAPALPWGWGPVVCIAAGTLVVGGVVGWALDRRSARR